ncbi:hypothetical protein WISP_142253 [Willisornis vidua]|uniref:Uncharacterized protein n=1 Tax=Willisornis vidua TaxID=1566151 RepID=A0ABQ9CRP8_9PASS|nr:hypothetical protein WISP_142253 [Willisornis vidua]
MGSALGKSERPIYKKIRAVIDYQGHKYDKASLKALATWINSYQLRIPEELNLEHWDNLGATLWRAEKKGDKIAVKALIAWRLVYMLLQDRQKTGLSRPAVNSAVTQDGGSKPSSPPANNEGLKVVGEDKMAAQTHCMACGENGGVGRHLMAWDSEGGAVGGASGSRWKGPPKYTPPEATSPQTTPTPPHVMAPPSMHDHAPVPVPSPAYTKQHGHAHASRPEAYLPEAYPPLPPRPPRSRDLPSLADDPAPVKPHRPEALAKPQASSGITAYQQLSIKTSRAYHHTVTHIPTRPPKQSNIETQAQLHPPTLTTSVGENDTDTDSERETRTSPLTRPKQKHDSNHMLSASAPRCNTFSVGAEEGACAFPALTTTSTHETETTQEIVEAQEKAWKVVHEQVTLAGDLDILKAFPVHFEEGRPPQWRPISYPVLKDIKKAITEHDLSSLYTLSLLESFFNAFDLTPNDIWQVASAWLPVLQYSAFEAEWKSLIKKIR